MKYLSVLLAITIAMFVHEIGHLVALAKNGIEVEELRLGIGGLGLSKRIKKINLFGLNIKNLKISFYPFPFPFLAFVSEKEESRVKEERLPVANRMEIYYAGFVANILLAIISAFGAAFVDYFVPFSLGTLSRALVVLFFLGIIAILPFIFSALFGSLGKKMSTFLIIFQVFLALALVIYAFIWAGGIKIIGPVELISDSARRNASFLTQLFVFSFTLGVANLIPVPPLDGGRIFLVAIEKLGVKEEISSAILLIGTILVLGSVLAGCVADILKLLP